MRAVNGDPRGDQIQKQPAQNGFGRNPFHRRERQRMMRDDQLRTLLDRFPRALRRDRQTGHHLPHFPIPIADQQADVVPIFRQVRRCELVEKCGERVNVHE